MRRSGSSASNALMNLLSLPLFFFFLFTCIKLCLIDVRSGIISNIIFMPLRACRNKKSKKNEEEKQKARSALSMKKSITLILILMLFFLQEVQSTSSICVVAFINKDKKNATTHLHSIHFYINAFLLLALVST